jgi:Reverse transcriptase (RNA-dependent DNA polymerase)
MDVFHVKVNSTHHQGLDLNKAFDRVNQSFLWKCLERFGFPAQLIAVLKSLYENATSKIQVNVFLSS